jgi:predicted nucleic acid-binding protein
MVLCDTNVLVALVDAKDSLHDFARRDVRVLHRRGLLVTDSVMSEATSLLPMRSQRQRLRELILELSAKPVEISLTQELMEAVFDWMDRYAEHQPDWADAHLTILSSLDRRLQVWTYDSEFRNVWRLPNGRRVPVVGTDVR